MATITHDNLMVCQDCTLIIANGDMGGVECEHGNDKMHALAMVAQWDDLTNGLVLDHDEVDFSTRPCDGCGSRLAGYRHSAVVIQ